MHSLLYALVPPGSDDVEGWLTRTLERYSQHREVPPYFVPLSDEDQAAMREHFRVGEGADLLPLVKEWTHEEGVRQEGRLGSLSCQNPEGAWDWWVVGGRWDGVLTGRALAPAPSLWRRLFTSRRQVAAELHARNSLPVAQLTPEQRGHCAMVLTPDGTLLEAPFGADDSERQQRWEAARDAALARHPDHVVVAVDCHS